MRHPSIERILKICFLVTLTAVSSSCNDTRSSGPAEPLRIDVVAESRVLATIPADDAPQLSDSSIPASAPGAATASPVTSFTIVFHDKGRSVAYVAQKGNQSQVVINCKQGNPYQTISRLTIGPDAERVAYAGFNGSKWAMVTDDRQGPQFDELDPPIFSPDGRHVAYAGKKGNRWFMVVDRKMNEGSSSGYQDRPVFSADSTKIAFLDKGDAGRKSRLVVSGLSFRNSKVRESVRLFLANRDRSRIAAVEEANGKQRVIEGGFELSAPVKEGPLYDKVYGLVFGADGKTPSYFAEREGKQFVALGDKVEQLPSYSPVSAPAVRPDGKGVDLVMVAVDKVIVYSAFYREEGKTGRYDEINDLVYNKDGTRRAFAAKKGESWVAVVNGTEGPPFDKVVTPLFSPDGRFLVYRARKDGKRFVVVADTGGKLLRQHPSYEMVFPTVFTADGGSVAYGVKDGQKLVWKVEKLL